MLEGKSEKLEFQEMSSSPHWKIEMSKNKTKMLEKKELREMENQRKNDEKKIDEWKDNEKWSFMKWSLVKITLKHNLGLFILSFETINHGIHYIPKSPFWLNVDTWTEEFSSLRIFFHNQQGGCLFSSANKKILINLSLIQDEFWIVKCIVGQSKKW